MLNNVIKNQFSEFAETNSTLIKCKYFLDYFVKKINNN